MAISSGVSDVAPFLKSSFAHVAEDGAEGGIDHGASHVPSDSMDFGKRKSAGTGMYGPPEDSGYGSEDPFDDENEIEDENPFDDKNKIEDEDENPFDDKNKIEDEGEGDSPNTRPDDDDKNARINAWRKQVQPWATDEGHPYDDPENRPALPSRPSENQSEGPEDSDTPTPGRWQNAKAWAEQHPMLTQTGVMMGAPALMSGVGSLFSGGNSSNQAQSSDAANGDPDSASAQEQEAEAQQNLQTVEDDASDPQASLQAAQQAAAQINGGGPLTSAQYNYLMSGISMPGAFPGGAAGGFGSSLSTSGFMG